MRTSTLFFRTLLSLQIIVSAIYFIGFSEAKSAETISVTDVSGRTVTVKKGVQRVILGEGRMLYAVALLDRDNPFQRIIGWKDDLIRFDPDAYRMYSNKFPFQSSGLANFGSPYGGDFSVEKAISMDADLVILDLGNFFKAQETGVIRNLQKVGIPVIFIDFRQRPMQNLVPSLNLLGKVFNREEQAQKFIDFYTKQLNRVTNVVNRLGKKDRPLVFIEKAAGYNPDFCCSTFGNTNFGLYVEEAGGINYGSRKFLGFSSEVSFEAILAADPDVIIGTGANWSSENPRVTSVLLGYDATKRDVSKRMYNLATRNGWQELSAVKNKQFYSIYHQFYNSPYFVVAIQQIAKWLHPDKFADLNPESTIREIHYRFLPINYRGQFWGELK